MNKKIYPITFDGNTPYSPRGCIAQAWSVAEVLRSWLEIAKKLPN